MATATLKLKSSPWGHVQDRREIAPGIVSVSTPSHGGFHLDPARQRTVRRALPDFDTWAGGPWYEEDCDWAVVAVIFSEHFDGQSVAAAIATAQRQAGESAMWAAVIKWLDVPDGAAARQKADRWLRENADHWEPGSMSSRTSNGTDGWAVQFQQIGNRGNSRWVDLLDYPTQATYTTEELDAYAAQ